MTKTEAQTEECSHLPVVSIIHLRVETVIQAVGIHLKRDTERFGDVGLKTQTGTDIMAETSTIPYQWHIEVASSVGSSHHVSLVIVPCCGETDTSEKDDIKKMRTTLVGSAEVGKVDEYIGIGSDVVPLVVA